MNVHEPASGEGMALLALLLAFVARPVSAFAATARSRFTGRERVLIGWGGLRGGVPVVLATLPLIEHVPRSLEFFNLVFFAVLVSTRSRARPSSCWQTASGRAPRGHNRRDRGYLGFDARSAPRPWRVAADA